MNENVYVADITVMTNQWIETSKTGPPSIAVFYINPDGQLVYTCPPHLVGFCTDEYVQQEFKRCCGVFRPTDVSGQPHSDSPGSDSEDMEDLLKSDEMEDDSIKRALSWADYNLSGSEEPSQELFEATPSSTTVDDDIMDSTTTTIHCDNTTPTTTMHHDNTTPTITGLYASPSKMRGLSGVVSREPSTPNQLTLNLPPSCNVSLKITPDPSATFPDNTPASISFNTPCDATSRKHKWATEDLNTSLSTTSPQKSTGAKVMKSARGRGRRKEIQVFEPVHSPPGPVTHIFDRRPDGDDVRRSVADDERYISDISQPFFAELSEEEEQQGWLQQDGATARTANGNAPQSPESKEEIVSMSFHPSYSNTASLLHSAAATETLTMQGICTNDPLSKHAQFDPMCLPSNNVNEYTGVTLISVISRLCKRYKIIRYTEENRPLWWPTSVPLISPHNMTNERCLTSENRRDLLQCYMDTCPYDYTIQPTSLVKKRAYCKQQTHTSKNPTPENGIKLEES